MTFLKLYLNYRIYIYIYIYIKHSFRYVTYIWRLCSPLSPSEMIKIDAWRDISHRGALVIWNDTSIHKFVVWIKYYSTNGALRNVHWRKCSFQIMCASHWILVECLRGEKNGFVLVIWQSKDIIYPTSTTFNSL